MSESFYNAVAANDEAKKHLIDCRLCQEKVPREEANTDSCSGCAASYDRDYFGSNDLLKRFPAPTATTTATAATVAPCREKYDWQKVWVCNCGCKTMEEHRATKGPVGVCGRVCGCKTMEEHDIRGIGARLGRDTLDKRCAHCENLWNDVIFLHILDGHCEMCQPNPDMPPQHLCDGCGVYYACPNPGCEGTDGDEYFFCPTCELENIELCGDDSVPMSYCAQPRK
jgi:hypothetical protein